VQNNVANAGRATALFLVFAGMTAVCNAPSLDGVGNGVRGAGMVAEGVPAPASLTPIGRGRQRAAAVSELLDIPYVEGGGHKQQLDLFVPAGEGFATMLLVHGGSLTQGDRKDTSEPYGDICRAVARDGIACAATSYRLFPNVDWPAPVADVAAAYAWLRRNIAAQGGSPEKVFLFGHSSGCTLVSLLGVDPVHLAPHGLDSRDIPGIVAMGCRLDNRETEERIRARGADDADVRRYFREDRWGARFGSLEALESFRPTARIAARLPPFLILIAEAERYQPPILADASVFAEAARAFGSEVAVEVLPGSTHYSSIRGMGLQGDPTLRLVVDWIRSILP
jgi:acetyl esterase/lipase